MSAVCREGMAPPSAGLRGEVDPGSGASVFFRLGGGACVWRLHGSFRIDHLLQAGFIKAGSCSNVPSRPTSLVFKSLLKPETNWYASTDCDIASERSLHSADE